MQEFVSQQVGASSSSSPQTKRAWRRLIWGALSTVAIVASGATFLFAGSQVACSETADASGPKLRCAFVVAAPVDAVWDAFTRTGEPRPYFFDAVLEADTRPGGHWRFLTDDRKRLLAGGEILMVEPPHRFEQTFAAADLEDPPSRMAVELEAMAAGCRVILVHDRFRRKTTTYRRFRRAHPLALSAMKSWLEDGELPIRARLYTVIFKPGMKLFTARAEAGIARHGDQDLRVE